MDLDLDMVEKHAQRISNAFYIAKTGDNYSAMADEIVLNVTDSRQVQHWHRITCSQVVVLADLVRDIKAGNIPTDFLTQEPIKNNSSSFEDVYWDDDVIVIDQKDMPEMFVKDTDNMYGCDLCHKLRQYNATAYVTLQTGTFYSIMYITSILL
jgi:hypothetical protein